MHLSFSESVDANNANYILTRFFVIISSSRLIQHPSGCRLRPRNIINLNNKIINVFVDNPSRERCLNQTPAVLSFPRYAE